MPPPPSRYRVVERGRRLVVEDSWAQGGPDAAVRPAPVASRGAAPSAGQARPSLARIEQVRFDGGGVLTTNRLYDAHGPRRLLLDPVTAVWLGRAKAIGIAAAMVLILVAVVEPSVLFVIAVAVLALLRRETRAWLGERITAWLDTMEPAPEGRE